MSAGENYIKNNALLAPNGGVDRMLFVIIDWRSSGDVLCRPVTHSTQPCGILISSGIVYRRISSLKYCSSLCEMCEISANAGMGRRKKDLSQKIN